MANTITKDGPKPRGPRTRYAKDGNISVGLSTHARRLLDRAAHRLGWSRSDVVEELLRGSSAGLRKRAA